MPRHNYQHVPNNYAFSAGHFTAQEWAAVAENNQHYSDARLRLAAASTGMNIPIAGGLFARFTFDAVPLEDTYKVYCLFAILDGWRHVEVQWRIYSDDQTGGGITIGPIVTDEYDLNMVPQEANDPLRWVRRLDHPSTVMTRYPLVLSSMVDHVPTGAPGATGRVLYLTGQEVAGRNVHLVEMYAFGYRGGL